MSFRWWQILAALVASVAIHGAVDLWLQNTEDKVEIAGVTSTQIDIVGNAFADMRMEGGEVVQEVAVPALPTPVNALKQTVLKPVEQAEIQPTAAVESTMAAAIAETKTATAIIAAAAVDSPRADQIVSAKPVAATDTATTQSVSAGQQAPRTSEQRKPTSPEKQQAETSAERLQSERAEKLFETAASVTDEQQMDVAEPAEQQLVQPTTQPDAVRTEVVSANVAPVVAAQSPEMKPVEQAEQQQVEPIETAALIRPIEPVPIPKQKPVQEKQSVEKKKAPQKKQQTRKGDRGSNTQTAKRGKSEGTQTGGQKSSGNAKKGVGNASVSNYPGKVTRKLRRSVRYPKKARSKRLTGTTVVRFRVSENGAVSAVGISTSSGSEVLDAAALASVKRAAPFPKIPAAAGRKTWSFRVPLSFQP